MKSRRSSEILRISCIMFLLAISILFAGCQKKMTLQDYLDLGEKYLTEANYEEAIVAFTKAIEVDPKALKAYEGLTNAYIKIENYEKAQEVLQSGIAVYDGLTEDEKTEEFKKIYEELLRLEEEIKLYLDAESSSDVAKKNNLISTYSADTKQERLITEAKEKYGSLLEQVLAEIRSQDPTYTHYFTDEFQRFVKNLQKPLIWQQEDGNYLGLYVGTDGDVYVYLGEMDNGIRSGYGSWYGEYEFADEEDSGRGTQLFYGNWSDDYPNGSGTAVDTFVCDYEEVRYNRQGNYNNGYENGTMQETEDVSDEEIGHYHSAATYNITNGVPHILYSLDGEQVVAECTLDIEDIDEHITYETGELWGVDGAMKE